jgi:Zn finger protein HypA/HybF involved in hydrogenase expression
MEEAKRFAVQEDEAPLQGVCKDCGNGSMNNDLSPAFHQDDQDFIRCNSCDSTHVDILS